MSTRDEAASAEIARRVEVLRAEVELTRSDYELMMVHLSKLSATVTDPVKRRAMQLLATVVATDYELKVMLLRELSDPGDREVWEKYLALLSWTVIEELPPRIGRECAAAGKAFKAALKPIRTDPEFMTNLADIRNQVVAHHGIENGDHWLAQWHLSAIANKHNRKTVLRSKIVIHSETVLVALRALGRALQIQHPDLRPRRA